MFNVSRKSTIPAQVVAGIVVVAAMAMVPYSSPADAGIAVNGIAVNGIAVNGIAVNRIATTRIVRNGAAPSADKRTVNPFAGMNRHPIALTHRFSTV